MKNPILLLLALVFIVFSGRQSFGQCNTNISICTPGTAGPFTFQAASPNPSTCLDFNNGQTAPNYAYIILYITQSGDLDLLIQGQGGTATGCLDVAIFDITGQADPCASLSPATELGCNYVTPCEDCAEFGTTINGCNAQIAAPYVNAGDVVMILVEDWSDALTSFTLDLGTAPTSAQTGPPDATITPSGPVCSTDAAYQLTAVDNGGTWTGPGTSPTGVFDPAAAGVGIHTINYSIGSAPCDDAASTTIEVQDCSVGLPCPDYSNTPTASSQACGGQLFDFEVPNTACPATLSFDVVGNYGSSFADEITWDVTSNLTGNIVASGGPGVNGGNINNTVNVDPQVEGTYFTLNIYDAFGDGFNGTGGFMQVEQGGTIYAGPITGNFGASSATIFGVNLNISSSTLTINTPSGPITNVAANCLDHDVQFALDNTNFCNPIVVNLPWDIVCDETGAIIASGTHAVTVYPQIPTDASDLVTINWNAATCQWDVVGQNDCDLLDIGAVFNISPDPFAWPANTCVGGSQDFTIDYLGVGGGPDCCSTGGPLGPITYNTNTTVVDAVVQSSPFGGVNNSAYTSISGNGTGGNATGVNLTVDMSGYCFPDVPAPSTDEYWVTVYVDGNIIFDQMFGPPAPANFNQTFTLADMPAGYNENSVVEVYIYPNFFNDATSTVFATYVPGVPCASLGPGEWTATSIDVTLDVTFTEQAPTAANCSFIESAPYTCCVVTMPTASNPTNINVECVGDVPAADPLVVIDEASPCNPIVTHLSDVSDGNNCPETITRTYRVTDDCGNFTDVQQLIIIEDTQAPVFAAAPADVTVECSGDVPPMTDLAWTDNCDGTGTVTGTDGALIGGTCGGTITRTWTYTDACGNSATATQTITVNDTQAPIFAAPPADVTVECAGDIPAMTDLGWTDNCDGVGTVTGVDGALIGGNCGGTITRTWTYTDACGNTATVTQTITVDDNTPPTASNPVTIDAGVGPVPAPDVTVVTDEADNCSVPTVAWVSDVSDGNFCPETITRTYSITDECGNTITVTQLITVGDAIPPTASNPAPMNVECASDVLAPDPLVVTDEADNSPTAPVVTWEDDTSDGNSCPETIIRRYRVTDDCGNFIFVSQTITILDVTDPVFATPPADVTVECPGDVPPMTDLGWTDNCDGAGIVTGTDGALIGGNCGGTITRTWTYVDACGNSATVIQTITVDDTTPPIASNLPPVSVAGIGAVPPPNVNDVDDEADNCSVPVVAHISDISDGGVCPETITRTYSVTDACGNSITVTQIITVGDPIPPTASNPLGINVECIGDVPAPDPLVVTDEADNGTAPIVTWEDDTSDGNTCPETITRRYRVTDDCGNFIFVTQTIIIQDVTAPILNPAPADVTVECIGDVPAMINLDWTDNCDGTGSVTGSDVSDGLSCPETITRTWTYTDACGNTATEIQIITVHDVTAPVFNAPPANVTVECVGDVPTMADLGWTDNCDGTGSVTGSDVSDGLSCPETITRTWTYTDACGNTSTETQTITVIDTQAPVFNAPPANVTVECIADVPAMTNLDWTDNCDGTGTVTGLDVSDGLSCPETITRTWTYTDACGNTSTETQIITVHDTQAPVFDTPPADITIECVGGLLAANMLGWTDNCDGAGAVMATDGPLVGGACGGTITRTWTYTDACGNTATVTQTITVDDTTPPTASNPATTTVPGGPAPAVDPTIVDDEADNCTLAPTVTFVSEVSDNNPCPETITRTYRVTDDCGNFIDVTHTILITDPIMPTATAPAAINVECIGDVPAADPLVITDEADNQGVPTVAWAGDVSDGQTCPETITRTYSITDVCGNVVTVDQIITVLDVTPPTATAPATVNVECIGDVPVANIADITDEADNCTANPVVAHVGDVSDGLSCPETITRTYSITDDCGNSITVDQLIIVNDITPPTASDPADISVPGPNDVPVPDPSVVIDEQDNCTVNPTVTWVSDVSDGNVCNLEKITRTYEVTDECGNSITVSQVITILAVPPPIDAGVDQTICAGDLVTIQESNPAGAAISWSPALPAMPCAPTQTQTYVVTADLYGCISEDSVTVTIEEVPTVSFVGDNLSGCSPVLVTFTNTSTAPSGISDCEWLINGELIDNCGPIQYQFNASGTYDITLTTTSGTGCVASQTYTDYVYVEAAPVASFTASDYQLTNVSTNVQFTNTTTGAVDYLWDFGDNLGGSTQVNPSHQFPYSEGGTYEVTLYAYSPLQCVDSVKATISVVEEVIYYIPNTFTPDDDNYNEYFKAVFTSGYDPYDFELLIFNRWGELIWESHDDSVGWDGTYGGEIVQDGTYTWKIEFKTTMTDERITVRGHVNVIR